MKNIILLLFSLSISIGHVWAQKEEVINKARTQFYIVGTKASTLYFTDLLQQKLEERKSNFINEKDFFKQYAQIENRFESQKDTIALIAQQWYELSKSTTTKKINKVINLILKDKYNDAKKYLLQDIGQLDSLEQFFLVQLYKIEGNDKFADSLLPLTLKKNNTSVWESRYQKNLIQNTYTFIDNKIFIAKKYMQNQEKDAAIGTLLEALEWNDKLSKDNVSQQRNAAIICTLLGQYQFENNDINNAYYNSKRAADYYESASIANKFQDEKALVYLQLAKVYAKAGAMKEASEQIPKAIFLLESLSKNYPERFLPWLAEAHEAYAQIAHYYDKYPEYESELKASINCRRKIQKYQNPLLNLKLAMAYKTLGHKLMNVDIKLFEAIPFWMQSKQVFDSTKEHIPLPTWGENYCSLMYSLGMSFYAQKKYSETIPYFQIALNTRKNMTQYAPNEYTGVYIEVMMQNARTYELMSDKLNALKFIEMGRQTALDFGDNDRVKIIDDYRTQVIKK